MRGNFTFDQLEPKLTIIKNAFGSSSVPFEIAGSIRRGKKENIGNINILVEGSPRMLQVAFHWIKNLNVITKRPVHVCRTSLHQIDVLFLLTTAARKGAALLYWTGDYEYTIWLRSIARNQGLKLNQYGLYHNDMVVAAKTEEDIFHALGMEYVEPQFRKLRK